MNTIHLTDEELRLTREALRAYLMAFGHNEADIVESVKATLRTLAAASTDDDQAELIS